MGKVVGVLRGHVPPGRDGGIGLDDDDGEGEGEEEGGGEEHLGCNIKSLAFADKLINFLSTLFCVEL